MCGNFCGAVGIVVDGYERGGKGAQSLTHLSTAPHGLRISGRSCRKNHYHCRWGTLNLCQELRRRGIVTAVASGGEVERPVGT